MRISISISPDDDEAGSEEFHDERSGCGLSRDAVHLLIQTYQAGGSLEVNPTDRAPRELHGREWATLRDSLLVLDAIVGDPPPGRPTLALVF